MGLITCTPYIILQKPAEGSPSITGTIEQGNTLTVDTSSITDFNGVGAFTYQWKRGGSSISGATSITYALVTADVGTNITITVSFTDGLGNLESLTSPAVGPILAAVLADGVEITGMRLNAEASARSIIRDASDNRYISGRNGDAVLTKVDATGLVFANILSGDGQEAFYQSVLDSSGNIYSIGNAKVGANYHVLLVKYNSSGTLVWQRTMNTAGLNDTAYGIILDSSNNIYITGGTSNGLLIAKYNSGGGHLWHQIIAGESGAKGVHILLDSSNNIYVTGFAFVTSTSSWDGLLIKFNNAGTIQWQKTIGSGGNDRGFGIVLDSSQNIYISGKNDSSGAGSYDILVMKFNPSGTLQWQHTIGDTGSEAGYGIDIDSSNNLYVFGSSHLLKYNSGGTLLWQKSVTNIFGLTVSSANIMLMTYDNSVTSVSFPIDFNGTGLVSTSLVDTGAVITVTPGIFTQAAGGMTLATGTLSIITNTTQVTSTLVTIREGDV